MKKTIISFFVAATLSVVSLSSFAGTPDRTDQIIESFSHMLSEGATISASKRPIQFEDEVLYQQLTTTFQQMSANKSTFINEHH